MSQIALTVYYQPSMLEIFVRFITKAKPNKLFTGFIDTGATVSLFPIEILDELEHTIIDSNIEIEQAGIAGQHFNAVEAKIKLYFEDGQGNQSPEIEVRAWFAKTSKVIIGFQDILDRAVLHVDYRQSRMGWLEL
jgi:hypothetical protein